MQGDSPGSGAQASGLPRVLVAPVPITPTKPFMPSHLKCQIWVDVLCRATEQLSQVDYHYAHAAANACQQTLGFWEYLDRAMGDIDYSQLGESDLGQHYVHYHAQPKPPRAALLPYLKAYEDSGWMHPASTRLLELWSSHFALLGLRAPGFLQPVPTPVSSEELIDFLCTRRLCVDARAGGGGVFLDNTAHGLPLRMMMEDGGLPNYMLLLLRDLVPRARQYDEIVLVHDEEISADYVQLQRTLESVGASVSRIALSRVAINGVVRSSRHGDWKDHMVPDMVRQCLGDAPVDALRLALRIFYICVIGKGSGRSFDADALARHVRRAAAMLDAPEVQGIDFKDWLKPYVRKERIHVDPYRLTTALLDRGRAHPTRQLMQSVFL